MPTATKKQESAAQETIEVPENVTLKYENGTVIVEGPKGRLERTLKHPKIDFKVNGRELMLAAEKGRRKEKKMIGTFRAHIKNMIRGVQEPFEYRLKICSGHFPMSVSISNNQFIVKNFFGERIPRVLKLREGVDVKVQGDIVVVKSMDKELAGQTAASIEKLTRRTKYDFRIFQDGIFITDKPKKELA